MNGRAIRLLCATACLLAIGASGSSAAPSVPPDFVVENAFPGVAFTVPTKIVWLPDGRALVAEKNGKVWAVTNGVKGLSPMVDISVQVLDADDRGLLSVAVDPDYFVNHYIYLLYTVDPDSNNVENNAESYARLVRYTVNFTDSATVTPSSGAVLFGSAWSNGIVSCSSSHTVGDMAWGTDGSLLVSAGDGASFSATDPGGLHANAFTAGRTDPYEDIGMFRSQSLSSLAGKVLRLDPATGRGYPSNPYFNGDTASIRSRVWAYGLRNPYRFTVRHGTGATDPAVGDPGTVFVGDVGFTNWEEQNVLRTGGLNLGWPCYEGIYQGGFFSLNPAHNGCGSMGTADNPQFQTNPALTYHHSSAISSLPLYPGLFGNTATGGVFYKASLYPPEYRQQYFFGDYGQSWLRVATVDVNDNITALASFGTALDSPVCFSTDPITGDILYISITTGEVRRIRYTVGSGNANPTVNATGAPLSGAPPLAVNFFSTGTLDPDGDPLTFSWSFGDATGSSLVNPSHTYFAPGTYAAVLTVTDGRGGLGRDTVVVSANGATTFPTTAILDDFNRADGEIGAAWTVDKAGLTVNNNRLVQTASDNWGLWNATVFGPNQEAWITITNLAANAPEHDLMLKVQGLSWTNGEIEVRYDDGPKAVYVATYTPGPGWQQRGSSIAVPFASGDRLGARALVDGTVEVYKNAALIGTRSVVGWPYAASGGRIGLTLSGATGSLDDFGGGDVVYNPNTAPTAQVEGPTAGTFFAAEDSVTLTGTGSDGQDAPEALAYHWDVELHHNTHIHFGLMFDTPSAGFVAENHDDGTGVFYRLRLRVTDTGGMVGRDSVDIFPEVDLLPQRVTLQPSTPSDVVPVTLGSWLKNLGRLPSNRSRWRLLLDGVTVAEGDTIVAALDSVFVSATVPALAIGAHSMRWVADTLGAVTEVSESNNALMFAFDVVPVVAGVEGALRVLAFSNATPNPSAARVVFQLSLPRSAAVAFSILDLQGRTVWSAPSQEYAAGQYPLAWDGVGIDGRRAAPGLYLARVRVGNERLTRRFMRLR